EVVDRTEASAGESLAHPRLVGPFPLSPGVDLRGARRGHADVHACGNLIVAAAIEVDARRRLVAERVQRSEHARRDDRAASGRTPRADGNRRSVVAEEEVGRAEVLLQLLEAGAAPAPREPRATRGGCGV